MDVVRTAVICPLDVDPRRVVLVRQTGAGGPVDADAVHRVGGVERLWSIPPDLGRWARNFITGEEKKAVLIPLQVVVEHVECE
jgi:hypothetical protein